MLKIPPTPVRRRATLAAALLLAAAGAAYASEPPPPGPDTTAIGFIRNVTIGTPPPDCDGCPPRVCPDQPYPVVISGLLPSPCIKFTGFRELPVGAPFTVLAAEFKADTCDASCITVDVVVPFSATVTLPPAGAGAHGFQLVHMTRACPDSSVAELLSRTYTYKVEAACEEPPPPPPSLDSLARRLVRFEVTPARRCPGDSLVLEMIKNGCLPCVDLVSLEHVPVPLRDPLTAGRLHAVVDWTVPCAELACQPETLRVGLGRFASGTHPLAVSVDVRVLREPAPDTTISFRRDVSFDVPRSCDSTDCIHPWLSADGNARGCALEVGPGQKGSLALYSHSQAEIGGLQGQLECQPPFRVAGVRPPAGQPRFHVSWEPEGRGARYVLFTSDGRAIPAGRSRVLEVDVVADAGALLGERGELIAPVRVASGPGGEDVPLCDITFIRVPSIPLCVATPRDSCDANGDGRADVRDLVLMTRCFRPEMPAPDSSLACRDCNGDGAFTFADLWCCARHVLRGPFVPRDSVRADDAVRVSFGAPEPRGEGWLVRVRVTGAEGVTGAMLRLRYPSERWRAEIPVFVAGTAPAPSEGWLPFLDCEEPGVVQAGGLRLQDGASGELEFLLGMIPTGAPEAGDRLVAEGADLVAPDGSVLTPAAPLPGLPLAGPMTPTGPPSAIALGPARPNPFARSTSLTVSLPREADVDLTVHDLAGRRVATLASGRLPAGRRDFTWSGSGVRDGLYFVRLTVDGRVYTSRVALLRDGR